MLNDYLDNPLYAFEPLPDDPDNYSEQASFVADKFPGIAVCLAGNGAGKSQCAAVKVARFLLETPPPRPNCPFWVLSKNFDIACGVDWAEKLSVLIPHYMIQDIIYYSRVKNWAQSVVMKPHENGNNWVLEFKSSMAQREQLQGHSIAGFWVDEQVPYEILMECFARRREYSYPGAMLYTLTPLEPDPTLQDIFESPESSHPHVKFYRMNSLLNTHIAAGHMEAVMQSELEERKATRIVGDFCLLTGLVYKNFDTQVHVIDEFPIPHDWYHFRGMDIGFEHPTALINIARCPNGKFYIYNEYCAAQASIEDHVEAIKEMGEWVDDIYHGPCYTDYGAAQERYEYSLRGLSSLPAKKDIRAGIAMVQRLFRTQQDGKPGMYIMRNCKQLVLELKKYRWNPVLDKPFKEYDDLCDAMRYGLYSDAYIPVNQRTRPLVLEDRARLPDFLHTSPSTH